jgi:hypothetical protein
MVMGCARQINEIDNGTAQQATGVRRKVGHQSASGTALLICWGGIEKKQSKVQCAKNQHRNRVANRAGDEEREFGTLWNAAI